MQDNLYLLAHIVELLPLDVLVTEVDGTVGYANAHALRTLGYEKKELIGSSVDTHLAGISGEPAWQELHDKLVLGENVACRINAVHRDGREVVCALQAVRVAGVENCPDTLVLILREIARELSDAEQIERKNLELAKMNTELIRSNAELKRVSEMKTNFLSIASHELKTPLTSIKGYSDIIIDTMKDVLGPDVYRMIENINRAADRLHKVVNNILDVTRIEQKRLKLKPEEVDLPVMIKECIEELTQFSEKRNISFKCSFAPDVPPFYGDRMRIHQVFTNLFSNALKYSPDGSSVQISLWLEEGCRFHAVVKDEGIGIGKEEQKKVFYPFYEVASPTRHTSDASRFMGGGTGLGLSIVKGIVERHGGLIWVVSKGPTEGEFPGSEFHVLLPVRPVIGEDDNETKALYLERPEEQMGVAEPHPAVEEKPELLFIDDDREAVEIARMVLENAFDVLWAEDGEKGLAMAFERRPSLILLDSRLPGLDGYRVCRILRTQDETRDIPIAFFSAASQNDEIQRSFACGADDFVIKPFSGRELVEKIWRVLMKKKEVDTFK